MTSLDVTPIASWWPNLSIDAMIQLRAQGGGTLSAALVDTIRAASGTLEIQYEEAAGLTLSAADWEWIAPNPT